MALFQDMLPKLLPGLRKKSRVDKPGLPVTDSPTVELSPMQLSVLWFEPRGFFRPSWVKEFKRSVKTSLLAEEQLTSGQQYILTLKEQDAEPKLLVQVGAVKEAEQGGFETEVLILAGNRQGYKSISALCRDRIIDQETSDLFPEAMGLPQESISSAGI